jgi:hypothetical protein
VFVFLLSVAISLIVRHIVDLVQSPKGVRKVAAPEHRNRHRSYPDNFQLMPH